MNSPSRTICFSILLVCNPRFPIESFVLQTYAFLPLKLVCIFLVLKRSISEVFSITQPIYVDIHSPFQRMFCHTGPSCCIQIIFYLYAGLRNRNTTPHKKILSFISYKLHCVLSIIPDMMSLQWDPCQNVYSYKSDSIFRDIGGSRYGCSWGGIHTANQSRPGIAIRYRTWLPFHPTARDSLKHLPFYTSLFIQWCIFKWSYFRFMISVRTWYF